MPSNNSLGTPAEWQEFLDKDKTGLADKLWKEVLSGNPKAPFPLAQVDTDEGICSFNWDKDSHHLEVDLFMDGAIEWFYLNRDSKKTDSDDAGELDETFQEYLGTFFS